MEIEENIIKIEELYKFLKRYLIKFIPENDVKKLLKPSSYRTFKKAFTHSSINNISNYEVLELLGDAKLKSGFIQYLYERNPTITSPEIFTVLYGYFLSKNSLSYLSKKQNFDKYIITNTEISKSIQEDVFESFIGALFLNTNLYIQNNLGDMYVYLFVKYIFEQENISIKNYYKYVSFITILKEIYDNEGWGKVDYQSKSIKNGFTVTVIFNKTPIGTGFGNNIKTGKEKASKSAILYFVQNNKINIDKYPNLSFIFNDN